MDTEKRHAIASFGDSLCRLAMFVHADADAHGLWDDFREGMKQYEDLPDDIRQRAIRYCATSVVDEEVQELRAASEDMAHYAEEAADVIISMLSTCVELRINIGAAVVGKILFNHVRPWKHEEETDGQK